MLSQLLDALNIHWNAGWLTLNSSSKDCEHESASFSSKIGQLSHPVIMLNRDLLRRQSSITRHHDPSVTVEIGAGQHYLLRTVRDLFFASLSKEEDSDAHRYCKERLDSISMDICIVPA